jgi:hypothetical protein
VLNGGKESLMISVVISQLRIPYCVSHSTSTLIYIRYAELIQDTSSDTSKGEYLFENSTRTFFVNIC